jgi:hypothetical protein
MELYRKLLVEIDLDKGELRRLDPEKRDAMGEPLELAGGLRIGMVITADGKRSTGSVAVPYSRQGMSRSYVLKLEGPAGRSQWMLVAGLAGLTVELTDEKEVEEVMAIATPRPDAH